MKRILQVSLVSALTFGSIAGHAGGPYRYHSVVPCRVVDTRVAGQGPALANGQTRPVRIQGVCGVPAGVKAVSVNLTAVTPAAPGYMVLFPSGSPPPAVSTLNFVGNDIVANGAIVGLGDTASGNDLSLYLAMNAAGSAHAIIDVTGYFQ